MTKVKIFQEVEKNAVKDTEAEEFMQRASKFSLKRSFPFQFLTAQR